MMKNVIRKILFEESEDMVDKYDDELTSPEISISPETELNVAQKKYSWESYIPEIGKKIIFYMSPEYWNSFAYIEIEDVDERGYGDFDDDSHPDYQKSILDDIQSDRYRSYYVNNDKVIGQGDRYDYVDVKEVIKDIKGFSEESEQITKEYKQKIQQLTKEYVNKMSTLNDKYNFKGDNSISELVSVDSKGNYKTERDFERDGNDWNSQPREFKKDYNIYNIGRRKI